MSEISSQSPLYARRTHIYPRSVRGRFRRLKWGVVLLAYGVYFLLPWLRWEREVGAAQAVLFDLAGRRFYLFDLSVAQVREPIFVRLSDGRIQNSYEIKVNNKTNRALTLRFRAEGLPPGAELDFGRFNEIDIYPEQRLRLAAKVRLPPNAFDGQSHSFELFAQPQNRPDLAPVTHSGVFFVSQR
jgi:polyferredoxin